MKSIGFKMTTAMLSVILIGIIITFGIAITISGSFITRETLATVSKSTQLESEKLDNWLSGQISSVNTLSDVISSMDGLANTLTANQANAAMTLEDQVTGILKPPFKAVLDDNAASFEVYMGFLDGSAVAGSGYQFDYSSWNATERGWYKLALADTSRAHITSPYVDTQTGELCITAVRAVLNRGRLIGVVSTDVLVTELQDIILNATLDSNGYAMLIDKNGDILVHPDSNYAPDKQGAYRNLNTVAGGAHEKLWKDISAADGVYKHPNAVGRAQYYTGSSLSSTGWYMVTALPEDVVTQPIKNVLMIVIPITFVILLLAALLIFLSIRNVIIKPLSALTTFMKKAGDTGSIDISPDDAAIINRYRMREDELGQCIDGVSVFVNRMADVGTTLEYIAEGDLTVTLPLLSEEDSTGKSLQKMMYNLNSMFGNFIASTSQVSSASKQIADGAQSLAHGSAEQAASVEELSAAISQIAQKTKENAGMAENAAELAITIKHSAEKGNHQMDDMMAAVKEINQASQSINKVIKVIDDIAFQTNILALNAAVEAARAGQAGKGFAVVAEEVRNLAAKSAEAAKETGVIIKNSIDKAELGARIADETAASLTEIVSGINQSNQIISEIAKSSEEQSLGIEQINNGIDQVAKIVQQNSATAQESAAASEEMSGQSSMLEGMISRFKLNSTSPDRTLPASPMLQLEKKGRERRKLIH